MANDHKTAVSQDILSHNRHGRTYEIVSVIEIDLEGDSSIDKLQKFAELGSFLFNPSFPTPRLP